MEKEEQKMDGGELARDVRLLGNALGEVLREQTQRHCGYGCLAEVFD